MIDAGGDETAEPAHTGIADLIGETTTQWPCGMWIVSGVARSSSRQPTRHRTLSEAIRWLYDLLFGQHVSWRS